LEKETVVRKIDNKDIEELYHDDTIKLAADIIKSGGLVAFPTETVYGLGADAFLEEAAKKIYAAKGRPSDNPLIVHIANVDDVENIAKDIPDIFYTLAKKYWPGPMTIVLKKRDIIPYATSGGLDTVAVRLPGNDIARALIEAAGVPIAAPSANTSGRPSPTKASHVSEDMNGKIDMIIDGGAVGIGVESTIIDLTSEIPTLLRPGAVTLEMLRKICERVDVDPAPKADMKLVRGDESAVLRYMKDRIKDCDKTMALLTVDEHKKDLEAEANGNKGINILSLGSIKNPSSIAHNLFDILRKCDELGVEYILSEVFDESGIGKAIMNRLKKAAGFEIIDLR